MERYPRALNAPGGDGVALAPDACERLVARIAAGEAAADEELVKRYGAGLRYLLRRWTRDPAVAEDLYQETFRVALEKIRAGALRMPSHLQAFLRGVARTLSTRYYEREGRWKGPEEDGERELAEPGQGQLGRLLRREKIDLIRQLLGELRQARDRELLMRFYIAEEGKDRICADLGLSDLHFNRVLFRARRRFRQLCEAHQLQP